MLALHLNLGKYQSANCNKFITRVLFLLKYYLLCMPEVKQYLSYTYFEFDSLTREETK